MAQKTLERQPWILLIIGALLLAASQLRFGIGVLAFLAPVPLLRYLRSTQGWRSRALFMIVTYAAWSAAVVKIVTSPMPLVMALGFALPISLFLGLPYLVWGWLQRRVEGWQSIGVFVSLMTLGEWAQHALTPFASWGAAAYTQVENLPLLQLASVTGMAGVSALVYLVAATLEQLWSKGLSKTRRLVVVTAGVMMAALTLGGLRLAVTSDEGAETVLVAAVGTDSTIGTTPTLPTAEENAAVDRGLFERTRRAAAAGARIVVWNEAATLVRPADETSWLARTAELARSENIILVAAYVLLLEEAPIHYENKYVWFRPDGSIDHTYLKHHPVPGEAAVVGTGGMPNVEADFGRLSGAICYDYDFPRLALEQASHHVDLVALPSSDWRGIDPIHTHMASVRAVEGGHSLLRSTRFGLSAGVDPQGRFRGQSSHFDSQERILLVRLPVNGVKTVYATLGDWFPAACGLFILWVAFGLVRAKVPFLAGRGGTVIADAGNSALGNDASLGRSLCAARDGSGGAAARGRARARGGL